MKITTNIIDTFYSLENETRDLNGYRVTASDRLAAFYFNSNNMKVVYDKYTNYLLIPNRNIPKKHKYIYTEIIRKANNVVYAPEMDTKHHIKKIKEILEEFVSKIEELSSSYENEESNDSIVNEVIKNSIFYSKKLSNYYNKIAVPISISILPPSHEIISTEKNYLIKLLTNDEIEEEKLRFISEFQDSDLEDRDTVKDIVNTYCNTLINLINRDIRLRQLKRFFKLTDENIINEIYERSVTH